MITIDFKIIRYLKTKRNIIYLVIFHFQNENLKMEKKPFFIYIINEDH